MPNPGRKPQNVRPNTPANGAGVDRQVRKTREAIVAAFNELVLERRYQDIRVANIIGLADIGRSTFYEHFRDKDDVLRLSLGGVLTAVADAAGDGCDTTRLRDVLDHFREQRRLALGLLSGPSAHEVTAVLAGLIEERLTARIRASGVTTAIPIALVAAQAAGAMLGLVRAWLDGKHTCPSADLATAMHRLAMASTSALLES
jgi:AcrR family transcriptional regulator